MTLDFDELTASLRRMGLAALREAPDYTPLTGGVSSDIWRVDLEGGPICIKRALAKLKVAADWRAPVGRNASEVAWIETANGIAPHSAPRILGHDPDAGLFAMPFYDPADYKLWKSELRDGRVDLAVAEAVGGRLGRIHAATAGDDRVAQRFANDAIFYDIRLEPYLVAAGRAHADLGDEIGELVRVTAAARKVLVHGDVSPKNILIGPNGPLFLDAECAWYGDPAFDLCFCLKHFLLKCLWTPSHTSDFLACFRAFASAYLEGVDWEPVADFEGRAATLLPGLFLARVDGKSPAEYLIEEDDKERVRRVARGLLQMPVDELEAVVAAWEVEVKG